MKPFMVMFAVLWFAVSAFAGDIKGKITINTADVTAKEVVVWLEGVKDFQLPQNKLLISQKGAQFSPQFLVVVAGQSVDMPNDDDIAHNVFSYSAPKKFNLGIYPKGEYKTVLFDKPGFVDLYCSIHRHMNAKIIVVPNPYYALTEAGAEYRIKRVPAGRYTLKIWHKNFPAQEKEVVVNDKGDVTVDWTLTK